MTQPPVIGSEAENLSGERGAGQAETARAVRRSSALHPLARLHSIIGPTEVIETESASLTWIGRPFHKNGSIGVSPASSCLHKNSIDNKEVRQYDRTKSERQVMHVMLCRLAVKP